MPSDWQDISTAPKKDDLRQLADRIDVLGKFIGSYDPALLGMRELQEFQLATAGCLLAVVQLLAELPEHPTEQREAG